jgi:STE24 endopeptidase
MNIYLIIVLGIIAVEYIINLLVETLNVRYASAVLPKEFQGYYDTDKYKQSQNYLRDRTNFRLVKDTIFTIIIIVFILSGGFNFIDHLARSFNKGVIITGLIFTGLLLLIYQLLEIPFSIYRTFVIEEKYGFNKTTVKTFITDILKVWFLGAIIGGIVFAGILWFFNSIGRWAWLYCWMGVTMVQIFLTFIAPVLIFPLFNRFFPLEDGELKTAIEHYANSENFKMKGVFKMDASRRSAKSNAFFTGFGKFRRIVLFDNLIQKHTTDELVSILAHEIGHYKRGHIIKGMIISTLTTGLMFFLLSFFINNKGLFEAFRMEEVSLYASLVFFGFLYSPLNMFFSIVENNLSRKYEYEADAYAVSTYRKPQAFITALKKLTVDNLSNLTPHPLKVFFHYSHPPVLERIKAVQSHPLSVLNNPV